MKTRYQITKEQLDRVVSTIVTESAEKGKSSMTVKDAAKKHKMNMGAEQSDDMGEGMKKAPVSKKHKMKHAPEVKKHVKGNVSENQIKKVSKHFNLAESEIKRRLELIREFDEGAFNKKLKQLAYGAVSKGYMTSQEATSYENKIKGEASKDNFEGDVKMDKDESGKWALYYVPSGEVTGKTAKLPWWKRVTSSEWKGR